MARLELVSQRPESSRVLREGADVNFLDVVPIDEAFDIYDRNTRSNNRASRDWPKHLGGSILFRKCDITNWKVSRDIFLLFGHINIAVANAGVPQDPNYFAERLESQRLLQHGGLGNWKSDPNIKTGLDSVCVHGPYN